jgi:type II secretory pathway component PulJ
MHKLGMIIRKLEAIFRAERVIHKLVKAMRKLEMIIHKLEKAIRKLEPPHHHKRSFCNQKDVK